jgi:hypothetical protein
MKIKYSSIKNGQYTVEINLESYQKELQELRLEANQHRNQNPFVSSFKQGILKYISETLLPDRTEGDKQELLFVFGNPAIHSIIHGMFFFSRKDGSRHSMWSKLNKAGVIDQIMSRKPNPFNARREEAEKRKQIILTGKSSSRCLVGMTTFYSFPTSAEGGVARVEKLFIPVLDEIKKQETERILSYKFTNEAKLVFVQKSSYRAFLAKAPRREQNTIFWPIRGPESSGEELKKKLKAIMC